MQWLKTLLASLDSGATHLVNDSKTPSGRVHVGALRGVLIHDAVYRTLRERNIQIRYIFGVDDYDPLDELPEGLQDFFGPHLGRPLCDVPPPPGSAASDLAEHYIREFFGIFGELGVAAETYRMRDVYRSGRFNDDINTILAHADVVRRVYKDVSNSDKAPHWYPFQVLCENCGRIGTTEVIDFDGLMVNYRCRHDLVKWATGCGHTGSVSPLNGNGKLPWKLEWVAKWHTFGITIEGAGKDHTTKGGSRDVAAACLNAIFGQQPPKNIPYEFFLVGGAKMSSSKGIGASARQIADLLPPEVLRYLVLKSPPKRPVNFSPDGEHIIKLFNEYDRLRESVVTKAVDVAERELFRLCLIDPPAEIPNYEPPFQLVTTLLQLPHLDVEHEIARRKGSDLAQIERQSLRRRIASAHYWLNNYASDEERFRVQEDPPAALRQLSSLQAAYLNRLVPALAGTTWGDETLQAIIYDTARETPIKSSAAFEAIYIAFLNRRSGPRAGSLLACLSPAFVAARLKAVPQSIVRFWIDSAESLEALEVWLSTIREQSAMLTFEFSLFTVGFDLPVTVDGQRSLLSGIGVIECNYTAPDGKKASRRSLFSTIKTVGCDPSPENERFVAYARQYLAELAERFGWSDIRVRFLWNHEDFRDIQLADPNVIS